MTAMVDKPPSHINMPRPAAYIAPAIMRATLIALACSAVVSFATAAPVELLGTDTLRWALWLAPAMLAGIWVGKRSFVGVTLAQFRRHVRNLLLLIAAISVLRSALDLVR